MQYLVTWKIDIEADTPEEAAQIALDIQRAPGSAATFFEVRDSDNKWHAIDLGGEE